MFKLCAARHSAPIAGGAYPRAAKATMMLSDRSDGDVAMKIIVSALVALSVLATVAAPASAFDAKSFYGQQDRQAN